MTDSATESEWIPNFIVDAPASRDELSSHDRIAGSIIKVVLRNPTIKMIGVLGGWGSGKSTIVQLLTEALHKEIKPKIACFTFDAWQHQNDPPRRAFLEALAGFLESREEFPELLDDDRSWRSKLDDLNRQKEELETTVTPTLTKPGRWFLASLFAWPVGMKLIGDGTLAETAQRDPAAFWTFVAGWFLIALPLLIAAGIYLSWRPQFHWSHKWLTTHRSPHDKESILSVIANKHVESKFEVKHRSPEATSIEFRDSFWQMVNRAQTPDRRLVIVVDNLDRLPAEDAIKIWSTIRSLMLGSDASGRPVDRAGLPTVIMPIDENAISAIYKSDDGKALVSKSFIEKTFDLVVHVPQPVLSRWHGYLKARMTEVFGVKLKPGWQHKVGSVYEAYASEKGSTPSPREMNAFVNALALLVLQRKGERHAIATLAWFVLYRSEIDNIHTTLADRKSIFPVPANQLSLAALHFGVDLQDAQELFMTEPLLAAFKAHDDEEFARLAAVPGFDRYFLTVVRKGLDGDLQFSSMAVAELLAKVAPEGETWVEDAWQLLRRMTLKYIPTKPATIDAMPGLQALIDYSGDEKRQGTFLRNLANRLAGSGPSAITTDAGLTFSAMAVALIEAARKLDLEGFKVTVPGGASEFVQVLQQSGVQPVLQSLKQADENQILIETHLANELASPKSSTDVAQAVRAWIIQRTNPVEWALLPSRLEQMMQTGVADSVARALPVVTVLYECAPDVRSIIDNWGSTGVFGAAFSAVWAQDDYVMATASAFQMKYGHGTGFQDGRPWGERLAKDPELVIWVDEALARLDVPADFNWLVDRLKGHPAELGLIQHLVMRRLDAGLVYPDDALRDPDGVNAAIPADVQPEFWSRLSVSDGFWKRVESLSAREAAPIFRAVEAAGVNQARPRKALKAVFGATSQSEWLTAIETGQEPYSLARELSPPKATSTNVGPLAYAALSESVGSMVLRDDHDYRLRWFEISRKLSPSNQVVLQTRLATALMSGVVDSVRLRQVLNLAGGEALEDPEFLRQADAAVVHIVEPSTADDAGRQWLLERADVVRPWVKKSSLAVRQSLGDRLRGPATSGEPVAIALMKGLGLSI